ncbi:MULTISPECIES: hypothetical protein [unclassified Streptomyces]|uniref:hypothetical protein n=1 Tax=unclassified Streptomyces TaxID=2593676 RepID=UPI0038224E4B
MSSPSPALVVPVVLWTVIAGAALITTIVLSVRAGRRQAPSGSWNPYGPGFLFVAAAAAVGYAAAAVVTGRFSWAGAAFGILWPVMAASALDFTARRRAPSRSRWAGPLFAAVGAALYGSLPL